MNFKPDLTGVQFVDDVNIDNSQPPKMIDELKLPFNGIEQAELLGVCNSIQIYSMFDN